MKKNIYRALFISLLLIAATGASVFADSDDDAFYRNQIVKKTALKLTYSPIMLIGGDYKTSLDNGLSPLADRYSGTFLGMEADLNWLFVGADFLGTIHWNGYNLKSTELFTLYTIRAGLNGKMNLINILATGNLNLFGKIGVSYNLYYLEDAFKATFPSGTVFYSGVAHGFGFTGGGGVEIENFGMIFGIGAFIDYFMPKFSEATTSTSMMVLRIPVYVGYAW